MADVLYFDPGKRRPQAKPLLRTMLGDVLRRRRLEQGRTLADVARAAKVSMPYLSELERGRKEASSEVLAAISAALGTDVWDLLAEISHASQDRIAPTRTATLAQPGRATDDRVAGDGVAGDGVAPDHATPAQALPPDATITLPAPVPLAPPPSSTSPSDAVFLLAA
jgi:transcriptional regulator with XRE-family HTH domain